ncbi:hypothetical protein DCE79_03185 [Lysinibacillus sp. 2017]|uniref:hypothetical protein n=1 Tax=unclassified Lysinibacillus TaxID=2636778 RepID=UPI000D528C36|nr:MULTISPECIES: hypothetical protein [unclassified Lysinibacillus]AWE06447.1 hypothetical protein DCE79_03185 [Lysinibacillus sp. 2017]TGN31207.1 hypothetical protein E4L99_16880 [Lysinibacillus sp. S2017]
MKKLTLLLLMVISVIGLSACQKDKSVSEDDIKAFLKEYKTIIYTADSQNPTDYSKLLEDVKPYVNEEVYEKHVKNGIFNFPNHFATENQTDVKLNDVKIDTIKEKDNNFEIAYTMFVTIGKRNVEKTGKMTIFNEEDNKFIVTYDWENPVTVDNKKFK